MAVHFRSDVVMTRYSDELLPVYFSSHQYVQNMTSELLLIFLATFRSEITFINLELEEISTNGKRRSS